MTRKTNNAGVELIKEFESCELEAYKNGKDPWTIGWGATYYADGSRVQRGDTITQQEADILLAMHIRDFEHMANKALGSTPVTDNQFAAFVSILFNVGPGSSWKSGIVKLKNGKPSTLLALMRANPNDPLVGKEFVKWISAGSIFENGLRRRRGEEVKLYYS